jgi:hypothetical protein
MEFSKRPVEPYVVPLDPDELRGYQRLRISEAPELAAIS